MTYTLSLVYYSVRIPFTFLITPNLLSKLAFSWASRSATFVSYYPKECTMISLNSFFTSLNGPLDMAWSHQFELPPCNWTLFPVYYKVITRNCLIVSTPKTVS